MTLAGASLGSRRGFVLVAVLWLGAFLIVLVAALLQQSRTTLTVARSGVEETIADAMLTGAVETLALSYPRMAQPGLSDGRLRTIAVAGGAVAVAVQDDNGLVDPNRAVAPVIVQVAAAAGDAGAGRSILARRGEPGTPSAAVFREREEIADLPNGNDALAAFFDNFGTMFSVAGGINPMTAPAAVLAVLPGVSGAVAAKAVALREQPGTDPQKVIAILGPAAGQFLDPTPGKNFDVFLSAKVGSGLTKTLRVTMLFEGSAAVPYRLGDWRPWAEQPAWVRPAAPAKG